MWPFQNRFTTGWRMSGGTLYKQRQQVPAKFGDRMNATNYQGAGGKIS